MASRFWVGGTGTWDSTTTTHWSASTGGAGGASAPTTGDSVTFDGSSSGGTVSVDSSINGLSLGSITAGAFTGTLDFSVGNPSLTITTNFSVTGTATRTINLGSGTFSFTGTNTNCWDATTVTGLTFNAGTSTILFTNPTNGNGQTFVGGGLTYATLSVAGRSNGSVVSLNGGYTVGTLTLSGKGTVQFSTGTTTTITNALNINLAGSSASLLLLQGSAAATAASLAIASGSVLNWTALRGITFTGNAAVASNSFDLGNNTNVTINVPASGGGGKFIGG